MSIRSIPIRPSLELDKKQAKRLLRAAKNGDAPALQRIAASHPRFTQLTPKNATELKLADVQLVLAREYGLPSWPRYKQLVDDLRADSAERAAVLVRSLCSNEVRRGERLLEREPELSTFDFYSACACGEIEFVRGALARDSELAVRPGGPQSWHALTYVCFSRLWRRDPNRQHGLLSVAKLLLAGGANPNSHYVVDYDGRKHFQTCLYAAAGISNNDALTRLLLEAGADVNELVTEEARASERPTTVSQLGSLYPMEALYHACEFKSVACLELLLEQKPDAVTVSYCLGRALDFRAEAAAQLFLVHGADPSMVVPWNRHRSHLHKAVMQGRTANLVGRMLEAGANPNLPDEDGLSPHQHAVRRGEDELARLLEAFGADRARLTPDDILLGKSIRGAPGPEREARANPDPDLLVRAARRGDLEEISRLLEAGVDVNATQDLPPLHAACYAGQLEAAQLIFSRGASLTQTNAYGGTPLGTCIYGSVDCFDEEGGPGACPPDEVPPRGYARLADWLIAQGAGLPASIWGGSEAVQEVLRSYGVPDVPSE